MNDRGHAWLDSPEATSRWLEENRAIVPPELLPAEASARELGRAANLLCSYVLSSQDLIARPGSRGTYISDRGCRCSTCTVLVRAPHAQAKKIDAADRREAERLMRRCLEDRGGEVAGGLLDAILSRGEARVAVAMTAYAEHLLRRADGEYDPTAAALVLWRIFAWTATGAPKQGFELTAEAILEAEAQVRRAIGDAER